MVCRLACFQQLAMGMLGARVDRTMALLQVKFTIEDIRKLMDKKVCTGALA